MVIPNGTTAQAFAALTRNAGLLPPHQLPVVFLASQNRGFIKPSGNTRQQIGSLDQRRHEYFSALIQGMNNSFTSLGMDVSIEGWFITLAQSANPYQKQEDNREAELKTVMQLLNRIDSRIDPVFMQIGGDGRVSLKIEGQIRELSHLSTGFASILKIIQAIVSGYGYFTNETRLQQVKGIVLIDENRKSPASVMADKNHPVTQAIIPEYDLLYYNALIRCAVATEGRRSLSFETG